MGVVVRGIGVWFVLQGIYVFFNVLFMAISPAPATDGWTTKDYVFSIIMNVAVGLIAIGTAEAICDLMYPRRKVDAEIDAEL
jgi:hypothetical protein